MSLYIKCSNIYINMHTHTDLYVPISVRCLRYISLTFEIIAIKLSFSNFGVHKNHHGANSKEDFWTITLEILISKKRTYSVMSLFMEEVVTEKSPFKFKVK